MIGQTLGHYKILEKLGAGGMGEVYRAEDIKLDREVAIKVLPEAVAGDAERLARFEREAKVLASLSHPNIAHLYGLEEADGQQFLVMELAAGEDLAERLSRGPIRVDEALPMALQIAEALEVAHSIGIVHRDLKPANIKVDDEGQVKLLDFGLAKTWLEGTGEDVDLSLSPTLTAQMTQAGVILGTASYMSPEQSRGQEVDGQTDIWAFGVVLFEMLTGEQVFSGDTVTDTIAAIIERQPDWDTLPASVPPLVRSLLRRCLQKDRRHRLHDMADARVELEEVLEQPAAVLTAAEAPIAAPSPLRSGLVWLVGGLVLGSLLAFWLQRGGEEARTGLLPSAHLTVQLSADTDLYLVDNPGLALSPDGVRMAWVANTPDGGQQMFVRELDQSEARPLPGTEGARGPFFSPDGRQVAYFSHADSQLKKVSVEGGTPVTLCDVPTGSKGGAWGRNGEIVFSYGFTGGLHRVSEDGGESEVLTEPDREAGVKSHRYPHFLPSGQALFFMVSEADIEIFSESRIEILEQESGARRVLIEGGMSPRYASSGHLLYTREGQLMAAPFDAERLELTGRPTRVLDGVVTNEGWGFGQYDLAANGTLLYVAGGPEMYHHRLVQYDRQGELELLPLPERAYSNELNFSPNGRFLAVVDSGANFDVWSWDIERQILSRLTSGYNNQAPVWSPDSQRLIFKNDRPGASGMYWLPVDGSGPAQLLLPTEATVWPSSWSQDGRHLLYSKGEPGRSYDLWVLPIAEDMSAGTPEMVLGTTALEHDARFSPDGKWFVYRSDKTGRPEIYLRSFPGPGPVQQVSSAGGVRPQWGIRGDEIFYVDPASRQLMRVAIQTSPEVSLSVPEPLFVADSSRFRFVVTPDGDHFVFLQPGSQAGPVRQLQIVFNFFEELERLAPTSSN